MWDYVPIIVIFGGLLGLAVVPVTNGFELSVGPHVSGRHSLQEGFRYPRATLAASAAALTRNGFQMGVSWSRQGDAGCTGPFEFPDGFADGESADGGFLATAAVPPCFGRSYDRHWTSLDLTALWHPSRTFGEVNVHLAAGAFAALGVGCRAEFRNGDPDGGCARRNSTGGLVVGGGAGRPASERLDYTLAFRVRHEVFGSAAFGPGEGGHYLTGSLLAGVVYRFR